MENNYLTAAFEKALKDARALSSNCGDFNKTKLKKSVFFETVTAGKIIGIIIGIIIAIALIPASTLVTNFLAESGITFPNDYTVFIMIGVSVILLYNAIFMIVKLILSGKEKRTGAQLEKLGKDLKGMTGEELNNFAHQIRVAIQNKEDVVFTPNQSLQVIIKEENDKHNERQSKLRKFEKISSIVTAALLVVCSCIGCFEYLVGGLIKSYGSASGFVVAISYIVLMMVFTWANTTLSKWFNKFVKYCSLGIFVIYQAVVVMTLITKHQAFIGITNAFAAKDAGAIVSSILGNSIIISLLLIIGVFLYMTFKTNFLYLNQVVTEGAMVPMQPPAKDEWHDGNWVRNTILWKGIITTVMTLLLSAWMSNIANVEKIRFGTVISYIVITVGWAIISYTLRTDKFKAIYGKFIEVLYLTLFAAYAIAVITSVPTFGFGLIFLLILHFFAWIVIFIPLIFV